MSTQFANTEWEWEQAGEWIRTKFDGRRGGWAVARLETLNPDYVKNARLILAAPDLLDALEAAQAYVDDAANFPEQFKPGVVRRHAEQVRAAIKKAYGE